MSLTLMKVPLMYSAASLPKFMAASTEVTPNCTITESVSPYIICHDNIIAMLGEITPWSVTKRMQEYTDYRISEYIYIMWVRRHIDKKLT